MGKSIDLLIPIATKEEKNKLFEILVSFFMSQTRILFILFFILINFIHSACAQNSDSTKIIRYFGGAINITNNGISLIPTFSLDNPAVTFDMAMGGEKLSFEPEFQFDLEGKPWGFFFWWRYKLVNTSKFFIRIGAHPALTFATLPVLTNGVIQNTITTQRFLAGEFTPNYFLNKNISIGSYYLYGYGIDNEFVRNTHLIMFNINFSNIKLLNQFFISYMPQVYYLRINNSSGFNVTSLLTISNRKYPLSISGFVNKTIQSNIAGSKNFIWNVSFAYRFNKKYAEQ